MEEGNYTFCTPVDSELTGCVVSIGKDKYYCNMCLAKGGYDASKRKSRLRNAQGRKI